jgi:hypothetical protein
VALSRREKEIVGSGGRPAKTPRIFVAYRMKMSESLKVRGEFEQAVHAYEDLARFVVKDGHVPIGAQL